MTKSNCDPSPEPFNVQELAKGNGLVVFTCRWQWDGISVYPDCAGSIVDVRVRNLDTVNWYAHLPNKTKGAKTITLTPGMDVTFSGGQLNQQGLELFDTISGLLIDRNP